ncbi:hypothetical protein [Arcanobacterium haemolyticum]
MNGKRSRYRAAGCLVSNVATREIQVSWAESIDDISVEGVEIVAFNVKEKILTINAGTFVQYNEVWVKNRQNKK